MQSKRKIGIVGSTGSIGKNACELLNSSLRSFFEVEFVVCEKNIAELAMQIDNLKPKAVCVGEEIYQEVKLKFGTNIKVFTSISQILQSYKTDVTLYAISGILGIKYVIDAIQNTKNLAIANKEAIVSAWQFMEEESIKYGTHIIPVDSEHNSLYRLLEVFDSSLIASIGITASGGPFFGKKYHDLANITPNEAMKHPNWQMGVKNTIDSATMANKVLELIEAMNIFNYSEDKIDVCINRQSIAHASVTLKAGGVISFNSLPNMQSHIGYAIMYPEYTEEPHNILQNIFLDFHEIKQDEFPLFFFGREIARNDNVMHTIFNIANEYAVKKFCQGSMKYTDILPFIENACQNNTYSEPKNINECVLLIEEISKKLQ